MLESSAHKVVEPPHPGEKASGFKLPGLRWWMMRQRPFYLGVLLLEH
jgi:hypothetical protein